MGGRRRERKGGVGGKEEKGEGRAQACQVNFAIPPALGEKMESRDGEGFGKPFLLFPFASGLFPAMRMQIWAVQREGKRETGQGQTDGWIDRSRFPAEGGLRE